MNKGDLINEVAKVVTTKKEAQAAVECVLDSITKTLKKKGQVAIPYCCIKSASASSPG